MRYEARLGPGGARPPLRASSRARSALREQWWSHAYAWNTSADYAWGAACADIGDIWYRVQIDNSDHSWWISQGGLIYYWWYDGGWDPFDVNDFNADYEVFTWGNSRFQFGGTIRW